MDSSFDAFGGDAGGWGDQGEQEFAESQAIKRNDFFDKIPLPVTISTLGGMNEKEEKYKIGTYTFSTVRTIGKISNVTVESDGTCFIFELIEPSEEDPIESPYFTVIRYIGNDAKDQISFEVGDIVQAIGKLRFFNERHTLISFNIRKVESEDEASLFKMDTELAQIYYSKNIPELSAQRIEQAGLSIFSGLAPLRAEKPAVGVFRTPMRITPTRSRLGNQQPITPNSGDRKGIGNSGLDRRRDRILQYINRNGQMAGGVSIAEIKRSCGLDDSVLEDLNVLLGEGLVHNTVDDDHFSVTH